MVIVGLLLFVCKSKTLMVLELSKHEMTVFLVMNLTGFYLHVTNRGSL